MDGKRILTMKMSDEELVRCPVCYGEAEAHLFGYENRGVWVGCIKSPECGRYVVYHKDGCTLKEAKAEWNRMNSGIRGFIRGMKIWFRLHGFGMREEEKAWERGIKAKEKAEREAKRKLARELLRKKRVEERKK